MKRLFEPGFVYPCDSIGEYEDLTGEVVHVDEFDDDDDCVAVKVKIEDVAVITGFWRLPNSNRKSVWCAPLKGYYAKIRVYRSGGGFYPDDIITGWSITKFEE